MKRRILIDEKTTSDSPNQLTPTKLRAIMATRPTEMVTAGERSGAQKATRTAAADSSLATEMA